MIYLLCLLLQNSTTIITQIRNITTTEVATAAVIAVVFLLVPFLFSNSPSPLGLVVEDGEDGMTNFVEVDHSCFAPVVTLG